MLRTCNYHNINGSVDDHVEAMKAEMQRKKPRDTLLSKLMKLTYAIQRDYILNYAPRVSEIFEKYPAYGQIMFQLLYNMLRKKFCPT